MSLERRQYEQDWAACADCRTKRPILQLVWVFRRPGAWAQGALDQPGLSQIKATDGKIGYCEGPAAPLRTCIDKAYCERASMFAADEALKRAIAAQHAADEAAAKPLAGPDLVGWVRPRTKSTRRRKVRSR